MKRFCFFLLPLLFIACDSNNDFSGNSQITGNISLPVDGVSSSENSPIQSSSISIDNLDGSTQTEVAVSDAVGSFSFIISKSKFSILYTTYLGVQFCSLLRINENTISDSITAASTLACRAALNAISEGILNKGSFDSERISNLENSSTEYLTFNIVNFNDASSVSSAANSIRSLTNEGKSPRLSLTPFCKNGEFTCGDGTKICAEYICNEIDNCPDESDERRGLCKDDEDCCEKSSACPQETSDTCSDECCCCSLGEVCDQFVPKNGCVASETLRGVVEENPLSKINKTRSYYNK